jgi:CheY-like chemotaxis protein
LITKEEIIIEEPEKPASARWKGKTILIAEDVEENYLYLKKALKKTQTDIIWAKNGEEAVKMQIEAPKIDLILMDIKMPKMNGSEAAKKIKEHNPNQIIIAQTAYARPEEKARFYDKNFDEYISKPIDPKDLLMVLGQFL